MFERYISECYVILNEYIVRYYCSFYCISLHDAMDYWIMHYYNLAFYDIVVYFTCIALLLYVIYVICYYILYVIFYFNLTFYMTL